MNQYSRNQLLIGEEGQEKIKKASVFVFGIGGVGSFAVEALARSGVGNFKLIDFDDICLTNINRQIHALHSTIGKAKVNVMKDRILDINPRAIVQTYQMFFTEKEAEAIFAEKPDYVVDAIDTVQSKVFLAKECLRRNIPLISSMGTGNRLSAKNFRIADISKTSGCRLAKAVRKLLRKEGIISGLKVVYSPDNPLKPIEDQVSCKNHCICPNGDAHCAMKNQIPGSISFVPSVAGLLMAGEVINDLLSEND
ncbi:UBA/THIF-type NAD/FAD binding protein [Syntrophobotulus glycolicus DSM 8271]|uniref:UBA/THIF-type NAD/FAD binding protein n=1 Tax=Syntrophobotulus glycolicus (strain DSM 8271 / FlGlyR) TaxID=645991 RepID=F0SUC0_SYNGF|nr:tRNA threonylcarbamoyladenosine dehydratase [Syntrophobotulus glycolicus]ADY56570.1 UBA/THIF-type NAD/FAD binding protein [Syntrophobotulus glycolicus DSM 8271]